VKTSEDIKIFLNITLSLINPGLFNMGLAMLRKMRNLETTEEVAQIWQSVYTGVSVICNRNTPAHRDRKGRPEWYNILLSYSGPKVHPLLSINDLGLDLKYSSGTVVAFCGTIFKHEARSWGVGDRVCYAHFMRESGRDRLAVPPPGWVMKDFYHID
jgi:hypothetical protein